MQPFTIRCPACNASLKVNNPKLLGKTLPCPKCSAKITVPESEPYVVKPTADYPIDSGAMTKVGDDRWNDAVDRNEEGGLFSELNVDRLRFRDSDEMTGDAFPASQLAIEPLETVSHLPPVSPSEWTSSPSQKSRQILLIAICGIGGSLLALGLFFAFIRYIGKPTSDNQVAKNEVGNPATEEADQGKVKQQANEASSAEANKDSQAKQEATADKSSDNKPDWNSVLPTTEPLTPNPLENPTTANAESGESKSTETPKPSTENASDTSTPANGTSGAGTKDENAIGPNMQLGTLDPTPNAGQNGLSIPRGLWDPSVNDLIAEAGIESNEPAVPETVDLGDLVHPPAAGDVIPDDVFATKIGGLKATQKPLSDLLLMLSQLTGAGFGIDVEAFDAAGLYPHQPIDVDVSNTNVAQFVQTVLEPMGLQIRNNANGLPIVFPDPKLIEDLVPDTVSLEGLFEAKDRAAFDAILKGSLPEEAHLATIDGTNLTFAETATPLQKYRIYALVMRLRTALGMAVETMYPPNWFASGWRYGNMLEKLNQPLTGFIERPRPVSQILQGAARQSNAQVVFDWQSLWTHGFTPSARSISVLDKRSFLQVSNRYFEDYSLTIAIMNDSTMILTTTEARRLHAQVLVVPMREGMTADGMRDLLNVVSPIDMNRVSRLYVHQYLDKPWFVVRICPPEPEDLVDLKPQFE